jgi:protein gp37
MAFHSTIEWTEASWNPVTGCTKVSPGCKYCYAERLAYRLKKMKNPSYSQGFRLALHENILLLPIKWKRPKMIFVNSMSDLFHEDIPVEFIHKVFDVMQGAGWHKFQILTKRSQRLLELNQNLTWSENIWMGVSVETKDYLFRVDHLKQTQAKIKFLSLEPLLGPIQNLDLEGIDWVIVGGESGPNARKMEPEWVVEIRDQCQAAGVPFFFKQWGGKNKKKEGRILEDRVWDEMPRIKQIEDRILFNINRLALVK